MKDDFSRAVKGRFYRPNARPRLPHAHAQEFESYILRGMARSLWFVAFAEFTEEYNYFPPGVVVQDRDDLMSPLPGEGPDSPDWNTITPDTAQTRAASIEGARALADVFGRVNRSPSHPMADLFVMHVRNEQGIEPGSPSHARRGANGSTWADLAYVFGEDLAQVSLGRMDPGAVLLDPGVVIPSTKVHYDSHDLTWEIDGDRNMAAVGDIRDL